MLVNKYKHNEIKDLRWLANGGAERQLVRQGLTHKALQFALGFTGVSLFCLGFAMALLGVTFGELLGG